MYYVNHEQLEERLRFLPELTNAISRLAAIREETVSPLEQGIAIDAHDARIHGVLPLAIYAEERVMHLAIETVTDIGSLLIDGYLMRDASSYEDIIEILRGEGVVEASLAMTLTDLVQFRRALVQHYYALDRSKPYPHLSELAQTLTQFGESVRAFVIREI